MILSEHMTKSKIAVRNGSSTLNALRNLQIDIHNGYITLHSTKQIQIPLFPNALQYLLSDFFDDMVGSYSY